MRPPNEERRPRHESGATSTRPGEESNRILAERTDFLREVEARSDAYLFGWHAGYDAGVAAAEQEMAEAWAVEVAKVRALGRTDDYMARVRAAEVHCRALGAAAVVASVGVGVRCPCRRVPVDVLRSVRGRP